MKFLSLLTLFFPFIYGADMAKYYKRTGKKFLDEKASEPGIIKLKSGMLVEILKQGENPNAKSPKVGDSCEVTYKGTFKDGSSFDSGTTSFAPNQVIRVRSLFHYIYFVYLV